VAGPVASRVGSRSRTYWAERGRRIGETGSTARIIARRRALTCADLVWELALRRTRDCVDPITPVLFGGTDSESNLKALCRDDNLTKGGR